MCFQQNGTIAYTAWISIQALFPRHVISCNWDVPWLPRSHVISFHGLLSGVEGINSKHNCIYSGFYSWAGNAEPEDLTPRLRSSDLMYIIFQNHPKQIFQITFDCKIIFDYRTNLIYYLQHWQFFKSSRSFCAILYKRYSMSTAKRGESLSLSISWTVDWTVSQC